MKLETMIERFTKGEVESLRGRLVRLAVGFTDVPEGTTGRVVEADEIEPGGYELVVEWDLPGRPKRQHDWFTKGEFGRLLVEE